MVPERIFRNAILKETDDATDDQINRQQWHQAGKWRWVFHAAQQRWSVASPQMRDEMQPGCGRRVHCSSKVMRTNFTQASSMSISTSFSIWLCSFTSTRSAFPPANERANEKQRHRRGFRHWTELNISKLHCSSCTIYI